MAYTIKRAGGFTIFKCTSCEYTVTPRDFDMSKGSNRTQAATAMNLHAILEHPKKPVPLLDEVHWFARSSRYQQLGTDTTATVTGLGGSHSPAIRYRSCRCI